MDQGRPRVPSFYALETLRAAEGCLPGFYALADRAAGNHVARLGWPVPQRPAKRSTTEFDLAVLERLIDADPETTTGAAHYLLNANLHLGRALARPGAAMAAPMDARLMAWSNPAQESAAPWRAIASPRVPIPLPRCKVMPPARTVFISRRSTALEPREEARGDRIDRPLTRGALFHEVQFDLLTALREQRMLPVTRRQPLMAAHRLVERRSNPRRRPP